jgi:DNA invertase Pin-like site-specific DNA recombinase
MRLRAVLVIRVSQLKGREGESFSSPKDQRDLGDTFCTEHDWDLVAVFEELQVSGDAPLEERPGLSQAVTMILTGGADIILGAHSERLWWSHEVRAQVLRLVQNAGGEVWAVDTGKLSGGTAAEDFSGEVRTSADRFSRRQNAEKSRKAVIRAVDRGVVPFKWVPPGLAFDGDHRVVTTDDLPAVVEAFELRGGGGTVREVRELLRRRGIERSFHAVQEMLGNPLYVGEVHFGDLVNPHAHPPAIDRALFERVQAMRIPRGRRPKSTRILARLEILRCGSCGARLVVGTRKEGDRTYSNYRCPQVGDCDARVSISARAAEAAVIAAAKEWAGEEEGRASTEDAAEEDSIAADRAQADLDAAIRAFAGLEEEPAAFERLVELREARDEAVRKVDHSRNLHSTLSVSVADWDHLTLSAQRDLIRATVRTAVVAKGGTGVKRLTIFPFSE